MIEQLNVTKQDLDGFIYSYTVPQLNKEFDLVKVAESACMNIELKSERVTIEKMEKQLLQNRHYLKMLGKMDTFFSLMFQQRTRFINCRSQK